MPIEKVSFGKFRYLRQRTYPKRSSIEPLHRGVLGRVEAVVAPAPKTTPYRDRRLLDLARGEPCYLRIPGICIGGTETTVPCHGNGAIFGKGMARKADDTSACPGCFACHRWLDQGPASAADKMRAYLAGCSAWVLRLREIAVDTSRPVAQQVAASQALQRIGASPLPVALWFDEPEKST